MIIIFIVQGTFCFLILIINGSDVTENWFTISIKHFMISSGLWNWCCKLQCDTKQNGRCIVCRWEIIHVSGVTNLITDGKFADTHIHLYMYLISCI